MKKASNSAPKVIINPETHGVIDTLSNPILKEKYLEFAKKEHSEENIVFLQRINEYKEILDKAREVAKSIYQDYISYSSKCSITITEKMKRQLKEKIFGNEDLRRDLFDELKCGMFSFFLTETLRN